MQQRLPAWLFAAGRHGPHYRHCQMRAQSNLLAIGLPLIARKRSQDRGPPGAANSGEMEGRVYNGLANSNPRGRWYNRSSREGKDHTHVIGEQSHLLIPWKLACFERRMSE